MAALSQWLLHTNRRRSGSWTQRYERGVPVTDLTPIPDDGATGTTVHFQPDASLDRDPRRLMNLSTATTWTHLESTSQTSARTDGRQEAEPGSHGLPCS